MGSWPDVPDTLKFFARLRLSQNDILVVGLQQGFDCVRSAGLLGRAGPAGTGEGGTGLADVYVTTRDRDDD